MKFEMIDVKNGFPTIEDDEYVVIAFVPGQGFQSCKYFNGSKTWKSIITNETVNVTHWLKRL